MMSAPVWTPPPASQIPTAAPAPSAAAPVLAPSATGRRVLAYLIDLAVVAILGVGGWLLTDSVVLGIVLAAEVLVALAVIEARNGQTLGKAVLGLRAAQVDATLAPGLKRESIRAGLFGASHLALGLGQFALLATARSDSTSRGQAWHDRVAGTRVVDIRPGRPAPAPTKVKATAAPAATRQQQVPHPGVAAYQSPPGYQGSGVGQIPGHPQAPGYIPPKAGFGIPTAPGWVPPPAQPAQLSGDSISMNEFRRLQQTGGRPQPVPSVVPPRPDQVPPQRVQPQQGQGQQVQGQQQGQGQRSVVPPRPTQPVQQAPAQQQPVVQHVPVQQQPVVQQVPVQQRPPVQQQAVEPQAVQASGPGVPPRPTVTGPAASAQMVLAVRGGQSYTVPAEAVVGRRPQASDPTATLIAVESASRALSRTHARIRLVAGAVWVEDLGSANGSRLHTPDGVITPLVPGTPLAAPVGSVLELGEVRIDIAVR